MRIKRRILLQTLSASAAFTLLVALMFFLSMANIRSTVLNDSSGLGDSAAAVSAHALEEEVTKRMIQTAAGTALFLNEYIERIENHTRMTADIAGTIYTRSGAYHPHPLPRTMPGQLTPAGPYLHVAPGARPSRAETDLAGNIEDALRQITVVDRGITTSTIGGESGYVIAMDIYPWPQADFDPRETPWYRGAKERGGLYWTAVYADLRGRGPAVSCAVPFYDRSGGKAVLRGVARSTVMLADMAKLVDSAGDGGSLFVLDGTGRQLFSGGSLTVRAEGPEIAGENYLEHSDRRIRSLAVSMTLGAGGVTVLPLEGVLSYAAYAPVESLGWSVAVAVPVQEVNAPAWLIGDQIHLITEEARADMDRRIIFFTALASFLIILTLLLTAFFSVRFTGAITRPILVLSEGVREVSGGNLDREVSVKTGDELEELALSFNAMTGRLREHIGEIARIAGERQRIETELDVAARIQMNMLPYGFPPFPGRRNDIDLYAAVHPAKEVGGDFYDFFFIDDERFAFTVADVSGKGVPAALFMAITKALLRNHLQGGEDPGKALEKTNRQLCQSNSEGMFVTLWLGVLDTASGRLEYINAGHNPPLLLSAPPPEGPSAAGLSAARRRSAFLTSPPDLVLAALEDTRYRRREIILKPGDTFFLYTDGVNEAADRDGAFYGAERLRAFLEERGTEPPREMLPALFADIGAFTAGAEQSDDITMLALRVAPAPEAAETEACLVPADEAEGDEAEAAEALSALEGSTLFLEAREDQLGELEAFIGGELDRARCPGKIRGQIELAAEEVFVNIARYAYTGEGDRAVTVDFTVDGDGPRRTAVLTFSDRGEPFNPLEQPDPDTAASLEEREPGGLGLLIVKRSMDTVEYRHEGGINRLVLAKSYPAGTAVEEEP